MGGHVAEVSLGFRDREEEEKRERERGRRVVGLNRGGGRGGEAVVAVVEFLAIGWGD